MPDSINEERLRKLLFSVPEKAIQLLYNAFNSILVSISERLTRDRAASEDIVQETFIHVWKNHEWLSLQHDKSIEHYLVRVVRNKSINYYRKDMRLILKRTMYLNGKKAHQIEHSVETNIIVQEMHDEFRRLITTFPPREKDCFLMSLEQDMTNKQIADHFKITVKAVERSLTSANKRLRKHWLSQ